MDSLPVLELLQNSCDPPLTAEAIEEIEILLGKRLPREYADFLLKYNGGDFDRRVRFSVPHPTQFVNDIMLIDFFGEPADGIEVYGLVRRAEMLNDRIPEDYLAIAHCSGPDLVLLKLIGPESEFQDVWFWDSSAFFDPDDQQFYWLADSFNDFLAMLWCDVCYDVEEYETIPIFRAIEFGNRSAVERYLSAGGDVECRNEQGQTLLAAAARYRWPKIVQRLLEHSADPNARDPQGRTPLHYAARRSIDSVKLLLAAGADATARDNEGKSVLAQWSYRADQILRAHGAVE